MIYFQPVYKLKVKNVNFFISKYETYFNLQQVTILLLSIIFGILIQSGFYGFNIDYYAEYYKPNLYYHLIFDRLGITTLTIFNFQIGLFLTSFSSFSGLLILKFSNFIFKIKTIPI